MAKKVKKKNRDEIKPAPVEPPALDTRRAFVLAIIAAAIFLFFFLLFG